MDSAIADSNDLSVSYSGSSIVDASSANSSAGNALAAFTDLSVANGRINNPILTDSNVAADGSTLTLNFSRALDSSDVISNSTFNVQTSSDGSTWQSATYSVDGDSTDFSNGNTSIVLRLDDSVLHSDLVRITYSGSSIDDSTQSHDLQTFTNFTTRNSSRVFAIESLNSTKSVIYEDLGFDGTPTNRADHCFSR